MMAKQPNILDLENFSLFRGIPSSLLQSWNPRFNRKLFSRRQPLLFPSSCADVIFFVLSGKVKISYYSEGGKEFTVAILSPGDVYSEHSLALATAVEETEVLYQSMADFRLLMDESPELVRRLIRVLGQILRMTNDLVVDLAFREAASRLARVFWRALQSEKLRLPLKPTSAVATSTHFRPTAQGYQEAENSPTLHLTHEELASLSGTTRQTVTEILRHWERQGILSLQRGQVTLLDLNRLREKLNG